MQVSFANKLREKKFTNSATVNYLGVRKELANCCLRFKGFEGEKRCLRSI